MIIEGAFFKLPELMFNLDRENISERTLEATLVNYFTSSMILEFNSRNVENPVQRIIVEKKYPIKDKKANADIYVDLSMLYNHMNKEDFNICDKNYIEVKCFTKQANAKSSSEPTTENTAKVVNDILRLLYYTERRNGRYFMVFFDDLKKYYLAFSDREYLKKLFTPGLQLIEINWKDEVKTFVDTIDVERAKSKYDKFFVYVYENRTLDSDNHSAYLIKLLYPTEYLQKKFSS